MCVEDPQDFLVFLCLEEMCVTQRATERGRGVGEGRTGSLG